MLQARYERRQGGLLVAPLALISACNPRSIWILLCWHARQPVRQRRAASDRGPGAEALGVDTRGWRIRLAQT